MKNIKNYEAEKYLKKQEYRKIKDGIYSYKKGNETLYVTSLSFVQEPNVGDITQYPLEDILDKFYCYISDFYEELNVSDAKVCYLEFAAIDIEDIKKLRSIIGKHVYNKACEKNGKTYSELVIE